MQGTPNHVWDDIVTQCGLTRAQIFHLPHMDKLPGLVSSVEVTLRVSRESLSKALMWLSDHKIRPVGRQFAGAYPGLLWNQTEIELHAKHGALGCHLCASINQPIEQKAS